MKRPWPMGFLLAATVLNGIIGGAGVVRAAVEMPAWRHVGALAWAEFSRNADLGNGLILYPVLGIGGALATIAAAIAYRREGVARSAAIPLYLGVAFVIAGMAATAFAAPQMLSLRSALDAAAIQRAFERFELWGGIRSVAQALAFGTNVLAVVLAASKTATPM